MLSKEQKGKLRKLLEKISTPEEMKAFDVEFLSQKNDDSTEKILEKIEESKPELGFIPGLISKVEKLIGDKIDELKQEFKNKKYPVYNDEGLLKKLDGIDKEIKGNQLVKNAENKNRQETLSELIRIGDILIKTQEIIDTKPDPQEGQYKEYEYFEGIIEVLGKILQSTGSNDNVRLRDSNNVIINPAKEETLQAIAGFNIPTYTQILATYPDTSTEVYTYKNGASTVGIITVIYFDPVVKSIIASVTKS
jgi:hypothetical protein